jgi:cytochrome c-type biogenesis protein CcsB
MAMSAASARPFEFKPELARELRASGIDRIAVQLDGVLMSMATFVELQIHDIVGRRHFNRQDPLYTVLSMMYEREKWLTVPMIPVERPSLAELLGLDPKRRHKVSVRWAVSSPERRRLVMGVSMGGNADISVPDEETARALARFRSHIGAFMTLRSELRILPAGDETGNWISPVQMLSPELIDDEELARKVRVLDTGSPEYGAVLALHRSLESTFARNDTKALKPAVENLVDVVGSRTDYMNPVARKLDYLNTRHRPFNKSSMVFGIAFIAFVIHLRRAGKRRSVESNSATGEGEAVEEASATAASAHLSWGIAYGVLVAATVTLMIALVIRYVVAGRMPLSNMYESVTFAVGAFALTGLAFEGGYRNGWIGAGTAFLGMILMTLVNSLPLYMRRVEPLIAVLNSFWLTWHVATLLISYAAFLLSFFFCLAWFWKDLTGDRPGIIPRKNLLEYLCYRTIQIGWPLLTVGILLGAVWADTAWGRPWSWDPKETWALITWFAYTAYLHVRIQRGWTGRAAIITAMIGFLMVLITYFGVTYIPGLAGGLHSYANPSTQ